MRVFVTGASGHVGSVVAGELIAAGHDVLGLARSDSAAAALRAAGVQVHRGDLDDTDSLRAGAAAADGIARDTGVSGYVGDGANRWPAVHELDAARLYRLALEAAPPGTRLHGAGEEGIPFRDIAEAIGRQLNVPTASIPPGDEAMTHFGFLGALVNLDNPTSRALTEKLLDWRPTRPGLIADLAEGHYFR